MVICQSAVLISSDFSTFRFSQKDARFLIKICFNYLVIIMRKYQLLSVSSLETMYEPFSLSKICKYLEDVS